MVFSNLILAMIVVLAAGAVVFGLTVALRTYVKYRGQRVITCPETHQAAAVHVNAKDAATSRPCSASRTSGWTNARAGRSVRIAGRSASPR